MSSKKREYHILMVTKTSFYDAGLMKTSTDIPKSALKQVSFLLDYSMKKYHKDVVNK